MQVPDGPSARPLAGDDLLPLTCARDGDPCCHGNQILIIPWELAFLAAAAGLSRTGFRDRHTCDGGTRLRCDGPPDSRGRAACTLRAAAGGCSRHPQRPLACRLFPLGRFRVSGAIRYYQTGEQLPCAALCPRSSSLPRLTLDAYLAGQAVELHQEAHDATANLAAGMVGTALAIADACTRPRAQVAEDLRQLARLSVEDRVAALGEPWFDLLTAADPPAILGQPQEWVRAHAQLLAGTMAARFGTADADLADAIRLYLLMALHLAGPVGADPQDLERLTV